jgi:[protein-PII] uridylyltransferase
MTMDAKAHLRERRDHVFAPGRRHASAREVVHAFTREIDDILRGIFARTVERHPEFERTSLIALGGYGRGEMCPYSDIDVLLLHDGNVPRPAFDAFTRDLWDLGASVGCVVRTMAECNAILGEDPATDNAYLDCSHVAGREELFTHLVSNVLNPYFRRRQRPFLHAICQELHDRVYSSVNTLYRVEPDLKGGLCALRDCQRMVWGERVYDTTVGGRRMSGFHILGIDGKHSLIEAYESLLKLRVELHVVAGRRVDLLELALQPRIADNLGMGASNPGALMEHYFRVVTEVRHAAHLFLERAPRATRVWDLVRRTIGAYPAGPRLAVSDGILFLRWRRRSSRLAPVLWMLEVFRSALKCHAVLSIGLRNHIRQMVRDLDPADFRNSEVDQRFRDILSRHRHVGRILQLMHETTFLEGLIPEFGPLTCRVEYDTYHEYTVDQHILLALCALDEMAHEKDPFILNVYLNLPRKPLLRLALLLHDVGKALPGNHSRTGAAIAENVALRLGFDKDETERIRFLVYHHLALSEISLMREPEEDLIRQFAEKVGDLENLDMLFILTVLDIRTVGSHTWTGWKAAQLKDIHERTADALREQPRQPTPDTEVIDGLDDPAYLRHALPEEREDHRRWLAALQPEELQLHVEPLVGFQRLTVVTHDRRGFLADFVGCLFAEGLWVVQARIHSTRDGRILDVFDLECDGRTAVPFDKRLEGVRKRWQAVCEGKASSAEMADERRRRYPQKPIRNAMSQVKISIDNTLSAQYTVLEVDVPDSSGLLHRLARELAKLDIVIASARIATLIDQVQDVFYLTDTDGSKIMNGERCEQIRSTVAGLCGSDADA